MVYVHTNLHLLSRNTQQYHEGKIRLWDIGGDGFDSFEGSNILEVANLSLDGHTMEAVLFDDDGEEVAGVASSWNF